ncbi:hypothetical protein A7E78_12250 [Syntrophotalea acetylenivorans]|uniref:Circularly permuted type 2 ATP-grasp protein n=1 Tax=Syntrophotalea acetylenivorans TaxID=1842532 RepID=A0A1L3GRL0_9BACT|nr:hypothetical protein [Syntrophotalea acetylenivorans]APG28545.1 hypothetical protein A7E78_12250 [Syntrophotalea acetylenivorans]
MTPYQQVISSTTVELPRPALREMVRLMRALYALGHLPAYRERVLPQLPSVARFDPGHDAVMMGYDFHLTEEGPRLIEVNTNAGGGLLAYQAQYGFKGEGSTDLDRLQRGFLVSFGEELARHGRSGLKRVAIIDETPSEQFLYHEMLTYADLLQQQGIDAQVVDPSALQADENGVLLQGQTVDLVYNRHCDFYLDSEAMSGLRAAYLAQKVCLTPNPFVYGLLADKRRMILWSDPAFLAELGLSDRGVDLLLRTVPQSRLLADVDVEQAWQQRKQLAFKPVTRFGSRGVLLGRKISRKRFDELTPDETLVQQLVPPSEVTAENGEVMKADFRLFAYRNRLLGVAARLYQGQVTNMRTPGGGYAPVRIV